MGRVGRLEARDIRTAALADGPADVADPVEKFETMSSCAREAEQAEFDAIWVYDHFPTVPTAQLEATFECWTSMAALARDRGTIRLGHMVTCNSYRPPSLLARWRPA